MKSKTNKTLKFLPFILIIILMSALSACGADTNHANHQVVASPEYNQYEYADYSYYYADTSYGYLYYDDTAYYDEYGIYSDITYSYEYDSEAPPAHGITLTRATVSRVIDGDTIVLITGERVRFIGVDAPEIGEAGANEATAFVRNSIINNTVWLEADGNDRDRFDRLRRYIWIQYPTDPTDPAQIQRYQLNALLLINGLAEVVIFGEVRNEDLFREIAQPLAVFPITPIEAPPQVYTPVAEQTPATYSFIGNRNSQVFHILTCSSLPAPHNRIYFTSRQNAVDAGHRPCGRCNP